MKKALCLFILLATGSAPGAIEYLIKHVEIEGEGPGCKHRDEIQLIFGPSTASGNVPSIALDNASSPLFQRCCAGSHILQVRPEKRACTAPSYLNFKFSDVLISSIQAASADEKSSEEVQFNFSELNFQYSPLDPKQESVLYQATGPANSPLGSQITVEAFAYPPGATNNVTNGTQVISFTIKVGNNGPLAGATLGTEQKGKNPQNPADSETLSGQVTLNGAILAVNGQPVTATAQINMGKITGLTVVINGATYEYTLQPMATLGTPTATEQTFADPVSTASGAFVVPPTVDLSLGGPLPLFLRRSYSSFLVENTNFGILGFNWATNFDPYIASNGITYAVILENGRVTFQANGSGFQTAYPQRLPYQLVHSADGGFRFYDPVQNLIYDFDSGGHLSRIEDRNHNSLTINQGEFGPIEVSDGLGRTLSFTYSTDGRVMNVTDQTGRSVAYGHNGAILTSVTDANGNTTTYSHTGFVDISRTTRPRGNVPYTQDYDDLGRVSDQIDSKGNKTTFSYVFAGTPGLTQGTDPLGRITVFNYADLTDLASVTDPNGQSTSYAYDDRHRPLTVTDRLGNATSVTYDPASGYIASITDAAGKTTAFTYQSQVQGDFTFYNLSQISFADGTRNTFTNDGSGNVLTATDGDGKITKYTYSNQGQVLAETNPAGGVTTYTYNSDGTPATETDPAGNVTTYGYDNLKRLAKIQHPDKTSISFTRDALDQILTSTDETGNVTRLAYDANNNLQSATDGLNQTVKATYDTDDLVSTASDPLGNTSKLQYDPLGAATVITNEAGEKTTFTYDNLERVQSMADPSGKGPSFTYDAEGRLTTFTDALGNTTKFTVDQLGRTTGLASPLGEKTSIAYDALDRVTSFNDALSRTTSFTYEQRGLPSAITAPGGISTAFSWGDLPVLKSFTDPNGNLWKTSYDAQGRLTSIADPLGQALNYSYDSRNRVSSINSTAGSLQIGYDATGNITQAQYSDNSTLTYTYDADNSVTGGTGFAFTRDANGLLTNSNGLKIARDAVGRITSIVYGTDKTVDYTYDSRGLLAKISDWAGGSVSFAFDAAHQLTTLTRSNGVVAQYTYDKNGRVASITETSGGKSLAAISLARDAIGRITSATRSLPQDATPGASGMLSASFDAANQISGFTYDARGRLTKGDAGSTYSWSAGSRLLSYSRADGSASFTYDGLGQRISRTGSDGAALHYVLNYATALPSVATLQSGSSDLRYYIYTPDGALLYSIEAAGGARHFYSFDETGNTTFLTADDGSVSDTYGISPYGDVITAGASNKTDNPFTWQGQWGVMQELGTNLFYMRFRYYDAAFTRFLSRDPISSPLPQEINPYQYASGDPLAVTDPMGLKGGYVAFPSVTRAQTAVFVIRAKMDGVLPTSLAIPLVGDQFSAPMPPLSDVPDTDPYFAYIQKMRELRITNGPTPIRSGSNAATGRSFVPFSNITRQEIAVFVVRAFFL